MTKTQLATLAAAGLFASTLFAQGLTTTQTRDQWEEINFEFNSHILSDGYPSLLRLAELLKEHPDYRVQLVGHTDYVGSVAYNEKLALQRANAVREFLIKYGANPNQLQVSGQGKRSPEVSNRTKEGRFMNRRVVMTVTDKTGKVIAAGGVSDVLATIDDRLKKLEECCSQILKKLDKLDDILAALRDLKTENEQLKSRLGELETKETGVEKKMGELPKPLTRPEAEALARAEAGRTLEEMQRRNKKFSLLGLNIGTTTDDQLTFTGKGRFFSPFGGTGTHAIQAEAEYMYFKNRQEGQFDIGIVNRWANIQAGLFSSFKHVNIRDFKGGGTLGQGAFTFDYLFSRGRVGFFGTKGFLDNRTVRQEQLGPNAFLLTYLKIIDQVGGSAQVGLFGDSYVEGNLGYLKRFGRGENDRPGGTIRFIFPFSDRFALTAEAGLNETLVSRNDTGSFRFGFQFGNWLRPKEYLNVTHPVPVDIPRVRYELLIRRVGNSPPVADAGPDQIGVPAGTITLNGSGSYDPDGDPLTYQWTQIFGPSVGIANANSAIATFVAAENESYGFRLTVKDPGGLMSTARTTVTTRGAQRVAIISFTADPPTIASGGVSRLSWVVENAQTVTLNGQNVNARSGVMDVRPTQTTTYTLVARDASGGQDMRTVTVTVSGAAGPRIIRFEATPTNIGRGETSTLSWTTDGAEVVQINGQMVASSGSMTVTPTETTTYTLTARAGNVTVSAPVIVTVSGTGMPRVLRFTATPTEILAGEQSTLIWAVENATDVSISPAPGTVANSGNTVVTPTATTTYTLTARNALGPVTATAIVTVVQPVRVLTFTANPSTVSAGGTVTLSWTTQNALDVTITGVGQVQPNGSATVTPTGDTTYSLTAVGRRSQASATVLVRVTGAGGRAGVPVADAGPNQVVYNNNVVLNGTRSYDPNGGPLKYSWRLVNFTPNKAFSGPSGVNISGGTTATPTVTLQQTGDYIFELTVTNNAGLSATATTRVTRVDP